MLKCSEIARILSSGEETSWMKQAQMKMHLAMCKHCSRYAEQLRSIAASAGKLFASHSKEELAELEAKIIRDNVGTKRE